MPETTGEVTKTDERCSNCGSPLYRVDPEDAPNAAIICNPRSGGCGMVDRYE